MKRALAMALGAMLVAGSAVPAAAKSQVDFNGMYRTYMYGSWNSGFTSEKVDGVQNPDYFNDFFLIDRLQMDFGFHATDEVSVYWRLRAPAKERWGQATGPGGTGASLVSRYYYGQVKQDWGTLSIGRLKDGFADLGLASLGYAPAGPDVNATGILPFDIDEPMSGLHYVNRTDGGFQFAAAILRPETEFNNFAGHDETKDVYVIEPAFFWDGGGASFGIHYTRDHVQSDADFSRFGYSVQAPAYKEYAINPAFFQSFGDFTVHFEGKAGFGKAAKLDRTKKTGYDPDAEAKSSGYALYLDADYNYGPGNVTLAAWWASGPDKLDPNNPDQKAKGTVGMGGNFAPLIVAYGANGNGWWKGPISGYDPDNGGYKYYGAQNAITVANSRAAENLMVAGQQYDANHMAVDLNGAHAFTDDLTFTYSIAYLTLNKVDPGAKKLIGYEADLGLQIQLLDNLHLGTTIGYLMAGDALKEWDNNTNTYSTSKPDDAYNWLTTLTFSF